MTIQFNGIPAGILTPGVHVEFDNSQANQGLPVQPHKLLVIGQKLSTGTATVEVPVKVISASHATGHFGRGSQLAHMYGALKDNDDLTESWALPMADNGAGVAATFAMALGTAVTVSALAVLTLYSKRLALAAVGARQYWVEAAYRGLGLLGAGVLFLLGAALFWASLGPAGPL